ncbi:MAG: fimbrial assembly protein [Burkholderiaceae bacterium]|nr:fimbrial assembly protein [Burkholderiaceae bacterium]
MNANDHVIRHVGPPAASALRRAGALACFLVALQGFATPSFALTLAQKPLYAGGAIPPLVMLDISKDQQLYKKAYNDYSDLDGDGALETTYKHSIDYYGYFDPKKCYRYSTGKQRFEPFALADANKYCAADGTQWSGNFLNWATMARMDAVRKLLYGGTRSTDTSSETVLERVYLPTDAHAWAKHYAGADLAKLTPFSVNASPPSGAAESADTGDWTKKKTVSIGAGKFRFRNSGVKACYGDQIRAELSASKYVLGVVTSVRSGTCDGDFEIEVHASGVVGSGSADNWTITNLTDTGVSICNLTIGSAKSQGNTNPPVMRIARGDYSLWASNERWQCQWRNESTNPGRVSDSGMLGTNATRSNGNRASLSGLASGTVDPSQTERGLGNGYAGGRGTSYDNGQYVVRVQACVPGLLGSEKCKQYPSGNYKPIGLLQVYGEPGLMKFGLMTGSYQKNISGGVLRKRVGVFSDEVETTTDGTFVSSLLGAGKEGIVNTLDRMRIWGYDYGDGTYLDASGDNCTWQLANISEGNCRSWGNPMSEIYFESLRYFAGKTATPAYTYSTGSADASLGLPSASWSPGPLDNNNYCSPLNVLAFNASVSSYDSDLAATTLADLGGAAKTARSVTNRVGDLEGITGGDWFIGRNGTSNNELCDGKTITELGAVAGICPEGPTVAGSYLMPGLAHYAKTNRIRSDLASVPFDDTRSLKVTTYGVQLATNVPTLRVRVPGLAGSPEVVIQPIYRLDLGASGMGGGALVDMKIVSQTVVGNKVSGKVYVNWEDSEQGGDYDQDVWGIIEYELDADAKTIKVTTDVISESTNTAQGFGYAISGTTKDGAHFHSGIENFRFTDPTGVLGCSPCNVNDAPTSVTYSLGSTVARSLEDPLFYAAKYGGFVEAGSGNGIPDKTEEWDVRDANGLPVPDGIPDNYFFVANPLALESALDRAFIAILATSSASSVATNSTSLNTGSKVYQARFNSNDWSGQLLSYPIDFNGNISPTPDWDSGQRINTQAPASRQILTWNTDPMAASAGVPFSWASLSAAQQTALDTNSAKANDGKGAARLAWMRGDATDEGTSAGKFRRRPVSKLGDIVNSNPQYVGAPSAGYWQNNYAQFRQNHISREPVIYVGANDGMLHAFRANGADAGKELFAYMPSSVYGKISHLTDQAYSHRYYVDGTPAVGDAIVNGGWSTVLVGGLGAGGQGLFALDVTDPTAVDEASASSKVLWEFTEADDPDLGYTFGQPQIVQMANGKWAVIVSNGYNNHNGDLDDTHQSATGRAALFILFLDRAPGSRTWTLGTHYVKLVTSAGSTAQPNGLANPFPADVDADGKVDYVYAGDLQGNLWKFDVSSTSPGSWTVANGGSPLFQAKDPGGTAQPITASVEVMRHPLGGYLVLFGTGSYVEPADPSPPYQRQSFYGIWDKGAAVAGRASLEQQTVLAERVVGSSVVRVTSDNLVDWGTKRGWYLDFPQAGTPLAETGERVVYPPQIRFGRVVFPTLIPSTSPCDKGGTSWLMELDAVSGGRLPSSPFDLDNDGMFSNADLVAHPSTGVLVAVSGRRSRVGITPMPTVIAGSPPGTSGSPKEFKVSSGSSGGVESVAESIGGSRGRLSWREIVKR